MRRPRQLDAEVAEIDLVGLRDRVVQVGGRHLERAAQEAGVAHEQRSALVRLVQPLVRVERDGVGIADSRERAAPALSQHGEPSVGGIDMQPEPACAADVAIVGAPTDDLVSDRPGARFAPRAIRAASCPPGPHLEVRVDATRVLRVVDFGDAAVVPADPARTNEAIERLVGDVVAAGALPIVLGGDHSIAEPDIRACSSPHGAIGLVHFDTHTDTGFEVFGVERSHGTPMYRLVETGVVDPRRYVQIGLRGYWPGEREFRWQREQGITSFFMHDVRRLGIAAVVERAIETVGEGPVFLSVDVDVLDPAFAPGTGTPEPGGMTSGDLLWACRELAARIDLVGAEVVEVIPTAIGSTDVTALVAERIVREILTGLALRRNEAG
jgi:agmatinase